MEQMCKNENCHRDAVASRRWYIMGRTVNVGTYMWIGIQHNGSCKLHLRLHFRNRKCNVFHSMRGQYFIIGDNYYSFIPRYPLSNWLMFIHRADPRPAPSQWETSLQSNAVSHRPRTNPETTLIHISNRKFRVVSVFNYIFKKKKKKR